MGKDTPLRNYLFSKLFPMHIFPNFAGYVQDFAGMPKEPPKRF